MLTSSSTVAVWWLWTWVIATAQWIQESLFDAHQAEVTGIIATQKPHTLQWYVTMAKAFQYGDALPADSDTYSPVRPAGDPAFVVTYAAAVETVNQVRIKVATGAVGALSALSSAQMTALNNYLALIKDAGVRLQLTSGTGDNLQTGMIIYYDPLVIDGTTGARIDGTSMTPVKDAINNFLDSLPFNGVFIFNSFVAALQAVQGVIIADVNICQANYAATPYINIIAATPDQYTPDAGYLVLDNAFFAANITYVAYT